MSGAGLCNPFRFSSPSLPPALLQSVAYSENGFGTSATISFSAASNGDLLWVGASYKDTQSGVAQTINTPTGWTAATSEIDQDPAAAGFDSATRTFFKIASGGETSVIVSAAENSRSRILHFMRFSNIRSTPLDVSQVNTRNDMTTNTISTGTTSATSVAQSVAIAFCTLWELSPNSTGATWTNSFTAAHHTIENPSFSNGDQAVASAYKILSATGTQETTATFTGGNNHWACGQIAVFKGA